jgi:hypothetical protein
VLPSGDLCDDLVALGAFLAHTASKAPTPVPLPFIAGVRPLPLRCRFGLPFIAGVRPLPCVAASGSPSLPVLVPLPPCAPASVPRVAAERRPL